MTEMEILDQMIKDAAKISLKMKHGKASVKLDEPDAPDSSVVIAGIPPNAIVIKVDAFPAPDAVFACSKGECKRADYVIIADTGRKKRILYIEMKRTKDSPKAVIRQLTGAMCFMRYCREIGRSFWKEKRFLKDYQHRFVSIGHTAIRKRKTRVERQHRTHDTPEKAMKIDWPSRLQFNHLVGG